MSFLILLSLSQSRSTPFSAIPIRVSGWLMAGLPPCLFSSSGEIILFVHIVRSVAFLSWKNSEVWCPEPNVSGHLYLYRTRQMHGSGSYCEEQQWRLWHECWDVLISEGRLKKLDRMACEVRTWRSYADCVYSRGNWSPSDYRPFSGLKKSLDGHMF